MMYWGEKCLFKLVSGFRNLVKLDKTIVAKERLNFARNQVEVVVDQEFPKTISSENEKGRIISWNKT